MDGVVFLGNVDVPFDELLILRYTRIPYIYITHATSVCCCFSATVLALLTIYGKR